MRRARSSAKAKKAAQNVDQMITSKLRDPYNTKLPVIDRQDWGSKKNDSTNPNNLWNLGEFRTGIWEAVPPQVKRLGLHPSSLLRSPAELPSGLFNLGATCYLNTQLQVLYHCLEFRSAIYAWASPEPSGALPAATAAAADGAPGSVLKTTAMRHAQLRAMQQLFATMQLSAQRCVSTAPFAAVYNLASGVQQDVQEFFKLFVTHVEESLATSADPSIKHILQRQFRGQASWVNNCLTCDHSSRNSEAFYELQVQTSGLGNLHQSLHEFCEVVSLSGSAQYACPQCDAKRDAVRYQRIDALPPVLHVQLSRYGYDFATGQKKKHHDAMHVPDVLNMSHVEHVMEQRREQVAAGGDAEGGKGAARPADAAPAAAPASASSTAPPKLYELCAVLYHHGRTANYGHYTCDVWDDERGGWFHFDDALVTRLTPAAPPKTETSNGLASTAGPSTAPSGKNTVGGQKRRRSATKNTAKSSKKRGNASNSAADSDAGVDVVEINEGGAGGGCFADQVGLAAFSATAGLQGTPTHSAGAQPSAPEHWCDGCVPSAEVGAEPAVHSAKTGVAPADDSDVTSAESFASRAEALARARAAQRSATRSTPPYASAAASLYPAAGPGCSADEYAAWCARRRHPGMSAASGSGTRTAYMLVYKRVHAARAQRWRAMQCAVGAGQVSHSDVLAAAGATAAPAPPQSASATASQDSLSFSQSTSSVASGPSVAFDSQDLPSGAGSAGGSFLSPRPPRHSPAGPTASAVKRACVSAAVRARELLQQASPEPAQPLPPAASLRDLQAPPSLPEGAAVTPVVQRRRTTRARTKPAAVSYTEDSGSESDGGAASDAARSGSESDQSAVPTQTRRSDVRSLLLGMADKAAAAQGSADSSPPKRRRGSRAQRQPAPAVESSLGSSQGSAASSAHAAAGGISLPLAEDAVSGAKPYAADVLPPPPSGPYQPLEHDVTDGTGVEEVAAPAAAPARRGKRASHSAPSSPAPRKMSLLPPLELCTGVAQWNAHLARRAARWVRAAHRAWALALARRALYMEVFASATLNPHASCAAVTVSSLRKAAQAKAPRWYWVPTAWLRAWIAGEQQPQADGAEGTTQDSDPSPAAKRPSPRAEAAKMLRGEATTSTSAGSAADDDDDDVVALDGSDDEEGEGGGSAQPGDEATTGAGSPTAAQAEELRQRLASLLEDATRQKYSPQDRLAAPGFALFAPLSSAPQGAGDMEPSAGEEVISLSPALALLQGPAADAWAVTDIPPAEMHVGPLLTEAGAFASAAASSGAGAVPSAGEAHAVMLPFAVPRAKRLLAPAYDLLVNARGSAARDRLGDGRLRALGALAWQRLCEWAAGDTASLQSDVQDMKRRAMQADKGGKGGDAPAPAPAAEADALDDTPRLPWAAGEEDDELDWVQDSWLTRAVAVPRALPDGGFVTPDALQLWIDSLSASRSNHSDTAQLIALLGEPEVPVPDAAVLGAARDQWVTACLQELRTKHHETAAAQAAAQALRSHRVGAAHLFPLASDFNVEHADVFQLPNGQTVAADEQGENESASAPHISPASERKAAADGTASAHAPGSDGDDAASDVASVAESAAGADTGREAPHLALTRALSQAASLWVDKDSPNDVFLVSRAFVRALKARSERARKAHAAAAKSSGARGKRGRKAAADQGSASILSSFLAGGGAAPETGTAPDADAAVLSAPNADLVGPRGFVHDNVNRRTALYVRRGVWEALQGSYPRAVPVHLLVALPDPWIAQAASLRRAEQAALLAQRQRETATQLLKQLAKRSAAYRSVRHGTIGSAPLPPGTYALVPRRHLERWREFVSGDAETHDLESLSWERFAVRSGTPSGEEGGAPGCTLALPTHVLSFLCRIAPVQLPPHGSGGDAAADTSPSSDAEPAARDALRLAFAVDASPHATEDDVLASTEGGGQDGGGGVPVEDFDIVPLEEWQDLLRAHPELRGPQAHAPPRSGADAPFRSLVEEDPAPPKRAKKRRRAPKSGDEGAENDSRKAARKGGNDSMDTSGEVVDISADISADTSAETQDGAQPGDADGDPPAAAASPAASDGTESQAEFAAGLDAVSHGALHPRESAAYTQYCGGLVAPVLRVLPCTKTPLLPPHIVSAPSTFGKPCPNLAAPDSCLWWTDPPLNMDRLRAQLAAAHAASLDFTGRAVFLKPLASGELPPGVVVPGATSAADGSAQQEAPGASPGEDDGDVALVAEQAGAARGSDDEDFVATADEEAAATAAAAASPAPRTARSRRRGRRELLEVSVNSADTPPDVLIKCFQAHDVGLGARLWFNGAPLHAQLSLAQAGVPAGATLYMETCADGAVDLAAAMSAAGGAAAPEAGFSGSAFLS